MYDKCVRVAYQANAVVDTIWFLQKYLPVWKRWHAKPGSQKLLMYDSAYAHLAKTVKHEFDESDTLLSVVPGGLTPILQFVDTDTAFVFHHNWQVLAHAWETANVNTKVDAATRRVLATRLCAQTWVTTLETVDIPKSFCKLGYLWPTDDGSHTSLRGLLDCKVPQVPTPKGRVPREVGIRGVGWRSPSCTVVRRFDLSGWLEGGLSPEPRDTGRPGMVRVPGTRGADSPCRVQGRVWPLLGLRCPTPTCTLQDGVSAVHVCVVGRPTASKPGARVSCVRVICM